MFDNSNIIVRLYSSTLTIVYRYAQRRNEYTTPTIQDNAVPRTSSWTRSTSQTLWNSFFWNVLRGTKQEYLSHHPLVPSITFWQSLKPKIISIIRICNPKFLRRCHHARPKWYWDRVERTAARQVLMRISHVLLLCVRSNGSGGVGTICSSISPVPTSIISLTHSGLRWRAASPSIRWDNLRD